jgi:hypothetical protein
MNVRASTNIISISRLRNQLCRQCLKKFHKSAYTVDIPDLSVTDYILRDFGKYRKFTALVSTKVHC